MHNFFATCPRGLEQLFAEEARSAGAAEVCVVDGGASFRGDTSISYRLNLQSRIAGRLLWQVAGGPYRNEQDVYEIAHAVPWHDLFGPQLTIRVYVTAVRSPLKSLDFITLKVKDAVCDRFRAETRVRPNVDTRDPDMRIYAHFDAHSVALYLDTSGEPLYKRGLRKAQGEAPLRENLAAGILKLAGWEPGIPLLDPMCGSATLLMEAAQMALALAPGSRRGFAFEKLKNFDPQAWRELLGAAKERERPLAPQPIYGSDLYGDALKTAQVNVAQAGLQGVVHLKQANILEISPPADQGILVTNPPYAVRMGEQAALRELYPKLGDLLKKKFSGWRAYILTSDMELAKLIRLKTSRRIPLYNGALECRLFEYKMIAGTMRGPRAA